MLQRRVIMIPEPGTDADDGGGASEPLRSDAHGPQPVGSALAYADFAASLKDALRDFHRPDLLARNPLLRDGLGTLGASAGPSALQALLSDTVGRLFGNPRDEKLRRVIELTYFQPVPKQEAVADRLSLPFGTYRRHLTTARERLTRWLWESVRAAPSGQSQDGETMRPADGGESDAPRLSLVVLPFVNIGGSAEHDRFVDGITETLTTDLSRRAYLLLISRNTAFAYKGKQIDTRQIARELGVRYVLEGSVQCADNRLRVNAQLIDAESGGHLWAERFDKPRANLLDIQDEVTARLARAVHIAVISAESRRVEREPPDRLDSVDYAIRGWATWNQPLSLEVARKAGQSFQIALRLDPHNVGALVGWANALMWEVNLYGSDDRAGQICAAEAAATRALALAPDRAAVRVTYGTVLYAMRAPERALREFEFAVKLDRHLARAHAYIGLMKFFLGRAGETRGHVEEAIRLSPGDPLLFHWHYIIGVADLYLGRGVRALKNLRRSVETNPNWALSQFVLAAASALAGLLLEAAAACAVARRLAPTFSIAKFRAQAVSDNPVYLKQRERLYAGMRLAGVPEG
jgi:TolB-like protein